MAGSVVGFKIREQRKLLGLTQASLARQLEISPAYLNLIESNKRSVGGDLLKRLANLLQLDVELLSGAAEQRLIDDLREIPSDPLLARIRFEDGFAEKMVAHNPDWARAILTLYRSYLDQTRALSDVNDRINRDPQLQTSIHRMLNHITSIRSVSEILFSTSEIRDEQRARFYQVLNSESGSLTDDARNLVSFFETRIASNPSAAIAEQVDEFIISNRNYFPAFERIAEELADNVRSINRRDTEGALIDFLAQRHNITVSLHQSTESINDRFRNQNWYDDENRTVHFLSGSTRSTRRFQMLRMSAELQFEEALRESVEASSLSSFAARRQTMRVLASYVAGAVMMPYETFYRDAEQYGYDIELLSQKYDASWEQVCHRLISLRKPGSEAVPLAFMRVDPAGYVSKRFPLERLPLPRYGHVCPLWPVFDAFQTPGRITRNPVEFPDGRRYLMIARTAIKPSPAFSGSPIKYSVMIACDVLNADKLVYSRGIDFNSRESYLAVGTSCNQCNRTTCQQRQELPWTLSE